MEHLTGWCRENNLLLKTMELIIDYRKKKTLINYLWGMSGECVRRPLPDIEENFPWRVNTSELLKKPQQRLYFLKVLRKNNISQRLLVSLYNCSIESIPTYCMCVKFTSCMVTPFSALFIEQTLLAK